jgi:hypothetical protein
LGALSKNSHLPTMQRIWKDTALFARIRIERQLVSHTSPRLLISYS